MKKLLFSVLAVITLFVFVGIPHLAEARARYGSHRSGGYTSHGKGSHYVGGYVRTGPALRHSLKHK